MRIGKDKTCPPISHGANTSVEGDHIRPLLLLLLLKPVACADKAPSESTEGTVSVHE